MNKCKTCGKETKNPKFCSRKCSVTYSNRSRAINEVGHVYGKLTVVERNGTDSNGNALWLCKCSCGNDIVVTGNSLRLKNRRHCGCGNTKRDDCYKVYVQYKFNSSNRNIPFNITLKEFREITQKNCYYCGSSSSDNEYYGGYIGNGIDRIDNNKEYSLENTVSCCPICNRMKNNIDIDIFIEKCIKISDIHR